MNYAADTQVPIVQSKAEVERWLKAAGCSHFFIGETDTSDAVGCRLSGRFIRFNVVRPDMKWAKAQVAKHPSRSFNEKNAMEKEHRRRWRCLSLLIKAKLAAVTGEIRSFDEEFLADTMMPDGRSVYAHVTAGIAAAYESGKVDTPLMLEGRAEGGQK
jgi:hypothetical protein